MFAEYFTLGYVVGKNRSGGDTDDDKWVYPADWIQMTPPESNQYIAVISTAESATVRVGTQYNISANLGDMMLIDWGDGSTDSIDLYSGTLKDHTYIAGQGTIIANGTEQFKITVTMPSACLATHGVVAWNPASSYCAMAMAYGADVKMWETTYVNNVQSLHQIQLPKNFVPFEGADLPNLQGHRALKKIITPVPITTLPDFFLHGNYSLDTFDLSAVQTIGKYALSGCNRLLKATVTLPQAQTIADYGLYNCTCITRIIAPLLASVGSNALATNYSLRLINAPLLANVGSYAMQYDESLTEFIYANGCTFGASAYDNCPNLYPKPLP